jgi:hypothetical protein
MRVRGRTAGVLLAALLAAVAVTWVGGTSRAPDVDRMDHGSVDAPAERAALRRWEKRSPTVEPAGVELAPPRPTVIGLTVRGRVTVPDATPPGSIVVVLDGTHAGSRYVGRGAVEPDGSFRLAVDVSRGRPSQVQVVACIPGWREVAEVRDVGIESEIAVDLTLETRLEIRGRVVDLRGVSVAGFEVGCVEGTQHERVRWRDLPSRERDSRTSRFDAKLIARAVTDDDGRFVVRGLESDPTLRIDSPDPRWWLESASVVPTHPIAAETVVLRRPAYRVEVDVVSIESEDDRRRWSDFRASIEIPGSNMNIATTGFPVSELPIVVRGPTSESRGDWGSGRVTIDVSGHAVQTSPFEVTETVPHTRVVVPVTRLRADQTGTLLVTCLLHDEHGQPARLMFGHHRPLAGGVAIAFLQLEDAGEGRWSAKLPVGTQRVLLGAELPYGGLFHWNGDVSIASEQTSTVAYPPFPLGRMVVRVPYELVNRPLSFALRRTQDRVVGSWRTTLTSDTTPAHLVPVGRYELEVTTASLPRRRWRADLSVEDGATMTVDVVPEDVEIKAEEAGR